jgi:predicted TIM-barrel fold metal-dependent hydrolase
MHRRDFLQSMAVVSAGLALPGCGGPTDAERYTHKDIEQLARQRRLEAQHSGTGPYGPQVYPGYRGLAQLPWFELDPNGRLTCTDDTVPMGIDVHAHLGMSVLFEPALDLQARTPRVKHLLDCDGTTPGCPLDLDIYANGNFSEEALDTLSRHTLSQGLWGSEFSATQTIPNLLDEMDAMRIARAFILPIKLGLPFGDRQTGHWRDNILAAGAQDRLLPGMSVLPGDASALAEMRAHAASGARVVKLHPTVQAFYPDRADYMPLYEEAQALGVVLFFHGGRAGIEPDSRMRYAMPRHYEAVLKNFPDLQVILGHAGARDNEAMLELALRYPNAWLGIHGQGVTRLDDMIERTGGERLLFGTDWPFYHIGMSLAKVLICTQGQRRGHVRKAILRDNALALFPGLDAAAHTT